MMSFRLTVQHAAWQAAQREVAARLPGLVPVIKGNGYGFGPRLLARECTTLGVCTVAVGVAAEVAAVRAGFGGEILVMAPLQGSDAAATDQNVLRTVAHADVLRRLAELGAPGRVVLELESPVHRHGIPLAEIPRLAALLCRVPLAGVALHLPAQEGRLPATEAALRCLEALRGAGIEPGTLWVSHLSAAQIGWLHGRDPLIRIRPRVGTELWLGDRSTFSASGTVLDSHPVPRHEAVGYRQRRAAAGTLIVVSGGTAHGVGLHSSAAHGRWRDLARAAAAGAAHGAGLTPSPFHWAGRRLRYADVPHMQVSMLLVPAGIPSPAVGDRLTCDVRMTMTTFDETELTGPGPGPGSALALASGSGSASAGCPGSWQVPGGLQRTRAG
jgi:Alanine racemase, N-terminal domain